MALSEEFEKQGNWLFKHRSYLPLILLLAGVIMYLRSELYPNTFFIKESIYEVYYNYFCLLISLFGLGIRVYTIGHTPERTSGKNTKEQVADELNATGIYSIVRHPLYLGNFFMWVGPAMLSGSFWFLVSFCFFFWIYYERIMFAEEQFLRKKFSNTFTDWAAKIPAFIPDFRNYKRPGQPMSWKKVLKMEKNGLAALFIIFSGMDIVGELIKQTNHFDYVLMASAIVSFLFYLLLKYLKNRTHLLDERGR
jgi:protein-S-isoprenylcysteine O-methyltransferase Ste14